MQKDSSVPPTGFAEIVAILVPLLVSQPIRIGPCTGRSPPKVSSRELTKFLSGDPPRSESR